jgi:ChrB-like protein
MAEYSKWVFLAYRIPREPSTPRITVWRKLKRLGVAQILDGLVALPLDARNREQLEWVADEIVEAGGTATLWKAQATTAHQERGLVAEMSDSIAQEYVEIIETAKNAASSEPATRRRTLRRLRAELRRVRQRDYFPPAEREKARRAVDDLAAVLAEA